MTEPVWTAARIHVLRLLFNAEEPLWALDLARAAGMSYGTVYHSFRVLYDMGWAVGVTDMEKRPGRPPRVRYRLTAEGRAKAPGLLDAEAGAHRQRNGRLT